MAKWFKILEKEAKILKWEQTNILILPRPTLTMSTFTNNATSQQAQPATQNLLHNILQLLQKLAPILIFIGGGSSDSYSLSSIFSQPESNLYWRINRIKSFR